MPTPTQLVAQGVLVRIEVELDGLLDQRLIYALPRAVSWLDDTLPNLQSDGYVEGATSPSEQVYTMFYEFISGAKELQMRPNCLKPQADCVWELRTFDLRFFGWFVSKGLFILSAIDQKKRCQELRLYGGYREQAKRDRDNLDLDPPKFIEGEVEDVL